MARSEVRPVDPTVWRVASGTDAAVPAVNSRVYYFPEGHWEQSWRAPSLSPPPLPPMVPCRVSSVLLLANPDTDEVFASIRLVPYPHAADVAPSQPPSVISSRMVSFAKVLTPSDANNGGGFSVPRFCADSVLPLLDFAADPPVQNLTIRDVHGTPWEFRHIYRGTPRRHLLTTGWSKFVNKKRLVAGDSVVFMREGGALSVGIRRDVTGERKRVKGESVEEAAERVGRGEEFEVVWYPRAGWGEFVVRADQVEEALNVFWTAGMKVKMAMETDDSSRMAWFHGTVSAALVPESGPWRGSPWKMLQVAWDEPEFQQHLKRVSPWQVEHVLPPSPPHPTQHLTKKSRTTQNSRLLTDGVQDLPFPILGLSNSLMGSFNSSMMGYCSLPAGMQGARQSQFIGNSLSNLIDDNTNQIRGEKTFGKNMSINLKSVSTELNIQSSQSEILSPDSQGSVYLFGTEIVGKQSCVSSKKPGLRSFQLFGQTIHVKDSPESNSDDTASAEGNGITMIEEADSVKKSLGLSLTVPESNLLDGIDYPRQSSPDDKKAS